MFMFEVNNQGETLRIVEDISIVDSEFEKKKKS